MNSKRVFSTVISTFGIFVALAMLLLSVATGPTAQAQDEPTDPHQPTIQAIINQRFTQTAHPQTPNGKTQTAQARTNNASTATAVFNTTLTSTAAFINTVDAQFDLLVQGTAQAGLAQLHISRSGRLSVNYPKGWLVQDTAQGKYEAGYVPREVWINGRSACNTHDMKKSAIIANSFGYGRRFKC